MLKKITVIALIVMLVMLLTTAVLAPFAVSQVAEQVTTVVDTYSTQKERLTIPAEGVKTVSFDHGQWVQSMELLPSPDGEIHVYSDEYAVRDSQFSYSIDKEHGHLEIGRYPLGGWNGLSALTPDNLMVSLSGLFNQNDPSVQLYLPKGIAYDLDSWMVGVNHWKEDEVETYYAEQSGDYNQKEEASIVSPDAQPVEPDKDAANTPDPESDIRKKAVEKATLNNGALLEAARSYADNGDDTAFWDAVSPMLEELADLYAEQVMLSGSENWLEIDLSETFREYMSLQLEESLLEVEQERLEKAYRNNLITKAEYYESDLELDYEQETIENTLDGMDAAEDLLERIERSNGVTTLFVEGFDSDRIMM